MKFIKVLLIIVLSFSLGIWSSKFFLREKDKDVLYSDKAGDNHEEGHDDHHEGESELELSKKSQELIGLKTQETKLAYFARKISVIGQIAQDPESSSHVTVSVSGVLAECKVKIGEVVKKEETICLIKSGDSLIEIKAPASGVVISDSFKTGDKVDTVSSMLDVYEKDIADVKLGQKVSIQSIAYPGKIFPGEITFISPRVDEDTHTIKVRALIQNPDYLLKLGMFINADIIVESQDKYIVLPSDAVHFIGGKMVVFIKTEEEEFRIRAVAIKDQTKDEVAVCEGLNEGEYVVVKDGFLLKSEFLKLQLGEGCAE
jgi:multidrug efflux pump subunit AcrA (membrane-fusion protein)